MPQLTEAGRRCGTDGRKEEKEVELTDRQAGQNRPLLGHLQSTPEFLRPCVKTEKFLRGIEMDDTEAGYSEGSTAERTCREAHRRECNRMMRVSQQHKGRKIYQYTSIIIPNKTASWLFEVGSEAI